MARNLRTPGGDLHARPYAGTNRLGQNTSQPLERRLEKNVKSERLAKGSPFRNGPLPERRPTLEFQNALNDIKMEENENKLKKSKNIPLSSY